MNIDSRLNALEKALDAGDSQCLCPGWLHVWYGSCDEAEQVEPPELSPCDQCGGWPVRLRVVYGSPIAAETI